MTLVPRNMHPVSINYMIKWRATGRLIGWRKRESHGSTAGYVHVQSSSDLRSCCAMTIKRPSEHATTLSLLFEDQR